MGDAFLGAYFGTAVDSSAVHDREFVFRYPSARDCVAELRACRPARAAFAGLDRDGQTALEYDLVALADAHNTADDGSLRIPASYLEVVVVTAR